MATAHRKIRRKDLKEKDEFLTIVEQVQEFFWTHTTQVLVTAALVAAFVVLAIALSAYSRHRGQIAGEQFYQAFAAFNQKEYDAALQGFTALADNDPSRDVGRLARFYMGACYLAKDDLPRAREAFVLFLTEPSDTWFKTQAANSLGVIYERTGDLKKAEEYYRQAASAPGAEGMAAEFSVARVLEREGNRTGAISAYQQIIEGHPLAAERQDALEALANLGAAPPEPQAHPAASH